MTEFSIKTREALHQAGWHEGRTREITEWRAVLSIGYSTFPALEAFLRQFGGLKISVWVWKTSYHLLHFDPCGYACSSETVQAYSRILGVALCPIGGLQGLPLLMDETGKVYLDQEGELYLVGDTGEEAIERICTRTMHHPSILVADIDPVTSEGEG